MRVPAVALALTVVLAGCSLPVDTEDVDVTGPSVDGTAPATPTVDADNPWRDPVLSVAIATPAGDGREYAPLVRRALDFWEANAERYAGYPVSFRLVADGSDADLVVSFVERVDDCENVTEVAGCAPVVTSPAGISRPETVEVRSGLSDDSTVQVLKHEFGHALGLEHDDDPQPLMAPIAELTSLPRPDATERALPWKAPELVVYVEYGNASDETTVREQVGHALAYFEGGADGTVPENVTFVATDDRRAADVVIRFRDSACEQPEGSCARRAGHDPDGDGALEYYDLAELTLAGVDPEATAWHVAYWLGYAFGFDDEEDWPAPLRDAGPDERRSEWWE